MIDDDLHATALAPVHQYIKSCKAALFDSHVWQFMDEEIAARHRSK